jgi:hypothetical protein
MPRSKQQKWSSQKARRERKRAISNAWLEEWRHSEMEGQKEQEEIKKRVEAIKIDKLRGKKTRTTRTNLWDWGFKSENHSIGFFPYIIISLVAFPVLGLLYKLSFTLLVPAVLFIGALIGLIVKKIKS